MATDDDLERLDVALGDVETSLVTAEAVSRTFRAEIEGMGQAISAANRQASGLSKSIGSSLRTAFDDLILDGDKLSDVMRNLGSSIASKTFNSAITPVTNAFGGAIETGVQSLVSGLLPFAKGGAFSGGRVRAFADGGVVDCPVAFPMRGGAGLMGEAGPEAIMPLTRGADGRLGVRAAGGAPQVQVTMQVSTPDAEGFRKSKSQIAAQLSRAISRGQRNL